MLAVSSLRNQDESQSQMESFSIRTEDFVEFSDGNILESINFDDIFLDINDGDVLPNLEMDPEIFADFSPCCGCEELEMTSFALAENFEGNNSATAAAAAKNKEDEDKGGPPSPTFASSGCLNSVSTGGQKFMMSKRDLSTRAKPSQKKSDKGKQSYEQSKNSRGKRKVKVDWTPELHRRFVQAVEQLGVDKAVPSRILEVMGIDCLTRHNIASHLQKYRSHRKHMLTREAEAASWNQRSQIFFQANGGRRPEANPWLPPTIGFPPTSPMHQFRPLHVWGHPTMDQIHMWPPPPPPTPPPSHPQPAWASKLPPRTPQLPNTSLSHWHQVSNPTKLTPVPVCFTQLLATTRLSPPAPVPGIPPHQAMYKVNAGIGVPTGQIGPRPFFDFHPSKESIDAALGDILSKPGMPLPLGLKPPAVDSVIVELQRQGAVPNIPIASLRKRNGGGYSTSVVISNQQNKT